MGSSEERMENLNSIRDELVRIPKDAKKILRHVNKLLNEERERQKKVASVKKEEEVPKLRQELGSIAAREQNSARMTELELRKLLLEVQKMRAKLQDFVNKLGL